jgi:uncharacterized protein (TIGR02246 family)
MFHSGEHTMHFKTLLRLTCLATLLLGQPQTFAQEQQGTQAVDHTQIQTTIDTNNKAVAAGDMEAILATFEATATMVAQPGMTVSGTPALREAFKQFLAINPHITVINQDLVQSGDIALHSYTWKMNGKTPDGHPVEQSGFSLVVLRKQPDGKWLMVIDNPFGDALLKKG